VATPDQHFDAARKFQAYFDDALREVGLRAPAPVLGETVNRYRREVLRTIKKTFLQNHKFGAINCRGIPADILPGIEPQILQAAVTEANNPQNVPVGEIRAINRLDETGRVRCIDFVGRESFVKAMGRPGRKVVSFRTPQGAVDASGRFLR
jgi:hypothetical protein